jgi:hypothetical protein
VCAATDRLPASQLRSKAQCGLMNPEPGQSKKRKHWGALVTAHIGPMVLFSAVSVMWTWPLVTRFHTAIPGRPGDNYSFVWNFWWMRHVLETQGASYFRTNYLFYPFGTNLANHSHTALLALIGATALRGVSLVTALNVVLLATVFLNIASMYALTWDLTGHRRAAILAGILYGTSPYLAVRLLGHYELLSAWLLPLFALCARRAFDRGSPVSSIAAGVVLAMTAYIAYYYVVYAGLFALTYLLATSRCMSVVLGRRTQSRTVGRARLAAVTLLGAAGVLALTIILTGGTALRVGSVSISMRTPQNMLTIGWIAALAAIATRWTLTVRWCGMAPAVGRRLLRATTIMVSVFLIACAPLLMQAADLVWSGEYMTTQVFWRSVPLGIDLVAPLLGHPVNSVTGPLTRRAYDALHLDVVEGMGWLGLVPIAILLWRRQPAITACERRVWGAVACVFSIWALGPFLRVGGFDTGLKLPQFVAQFVPIVSNAHMPGRAIVGIFLALAVVVGLRISRAVGALQRPSVQWLLIALLIVEYADAPVPLTNLDQPAIYRQLAAQPPGGVCEAPFGVGDGLGVGVGAQDRIVLYYATIHEHPLVGGYVGRMPRNAAQKYAALPVTQQLLSLSDGDAPDVTPALASKLTAESPCTYLVLDRAHAAPQLVAYLQSLPLTLLARADGRELFRLQPSK